jgi:hypothetical protein
VAGQVECPLEVGFDLAADSELMAALRDVDLAEVRLHDCRAPGRRYTTDSVKCSVESDGPKSTDCGRSMKWSAFHKLTAGDHLRQ